MHRIPKQTFSTAAAIQKQIAKRQQDDRGLNLPEGTWADMQRLHRQVHKARRRGWHEAARRLTEEFSYQADNCHYRLLELLATLRERTNSSTLPTQAEICQEILALQNEFDEVEVEPNTGEICVTVGPITLEDIHFGRFEIRLDWEGPSSSSPYRVVALDPNPAASNDSVTHPHVQDERLCEGEGRAAIRAAIAQGRLLDFFTIVSQTLFTYARGSAYVELDRWGGEMTIPVSVDYSRPFPPSDHEGWRAEYLANVHEELFVRPTPEDPKALADPRYSEQFEPFGADAESQDWWPDLFEELTEYQELQHGNRI